MKKINISGYEASKEQLSENNHKNSQKSNEIFLISSKGEVYINPNIKLKK